MGQQLQMLFGCQFVIERDKHTSHLKDRVRGNQPLRLISHDDGGTISRAELRVLKSTRQRRGSLLEVGISKTSALAVAVRLDQASLIRPAIEGIAERSADTCVLIEIEHSVIISPRRHPSTSPGQAPARRRQVVNSTAWLGFVPPAF